MRSTSPEDTIPSTIGQHARALAQYWPDTVMLLAFAIFGASIIVLVLRSLRSRTQSWWQVIGFTALGLGTLVALGLAVEWLRRHRVSSGVTVAGLFWVAVAVAWGVRRLAGRVSQAGPSERVAIWQRVGAWALIALGGVFGLGGALELASRPYYVHDQVLGWVVVLGVSPLLVGYYWLTHRPAVGIALTGVALLSYILLFPPVSEFRLGEGAHLIGIIGAVLLAAGLLHLVERWLGSR